jgi:hypothetical protein
VHGARFCAMQKTFITAISLLTLPLMAAACSPRSDEQSSSIATEAAASESFGATATQIADLETPNPRASARVLALEGLGDLKIGQPLPKNSTWAVRGAQTSEGCRTVSSPDYPGVYGILSDNKIERITLGQRSDVKLAEGIGVGATEADVKKWFAGFQAEPHKYEDAPAKYLTAPNAQSGSSALRFEIGSNGKVAMIHVGIMPVLAYVEACA